MPLKQQFSDALKNAMRSGDGLRRDVLRGVLTAISRAEIPGMEVEDETAGRRELSDDEVMQVVEKQAKQRRDSIEAFTKANRQDLIDKERSELAILEEYLPKQLSRDEIAAEVRAVIAETGASGPADKNKVMPAAIARMKGRADGRAINEVVTELLAGR
jgi:uncharacterized protein YqeY